MVAARVVEARVVEAGVDDTALTVDGVPELNELNRCGVDGLAYAGFCCPIDGCRRRLFPLTVSCSVSIREKVAPARRGVSPWAPDVMAAVALLAVVAPVPPASFTSSWLIRSADLYCTPSSILASSTSEK